MPHNKKRGNTSGLRLRFDPLELEKKRHEAKFREEPFNEIWGMIQEVTEHSSATRKALRDTMDHVQGALWVLYEEKRGGG